MYIHNFSCFNLMFYLMRVAFSFIRFPRFIHPMINSIEWSTTPKRKRRDEMKTTVQELSVQAQREHKYTHTNKIEISSKWVVFRLCFCVICVRCLCLMPFYVIWCSVRCDLCVVSLLFEIKHLKIYWVFIHQHIFLSTIRWLEIYLNGFLLHCKHTGH